MREIFGIIFKTKILSAVISLVRFFVTKEMNIKNYFSLKMLIIKRIDKKTATKYPNTPKIGISII